MEERDTSSELEKIVNDVLSIRNNLPNSELPKEEKVETGDVYSLVNLYAEHAAMFEILSKRLLDVKVEKLENKTIKDLLKDTSEEKVEKIKKEHIEKLKEIKGKLDNSKQEDKKIIELIDEVLKLKDTKKHIAVNRLRASDKDKENLRIASEIRKEYMTSDELSNFQGIPNSIQITDIHNDMYHFLLGMTEPIGNPPESAFTIDSQNPIITTKEGYTYPNLVYNPKFTGTITFGGDLIQSHDSGVNDNLGAIPLCLAMRHCMEEANKNSKKIVYVAGNHELEALNEGQHPEVRTIMQNMFKEGLVEYCHYDKVSDTLISHTKLNKPLVLKILRDYKEKCKKENPNDFDKISELNELVGTIENGKGIIGHEEKQKNIRKNLAKILNENFDKHFEIDQNALFTKDPEGINDFAIVGEELERTYFRANFDSISLGNNKQELKYLMDLSFALKKSKGTVSIGPNQDNFKASDFYELLDLLNNKESPLMIKNDNDIISLSWSGKFQDKETPFEIRKNGFTSILTNFSVLSETFSSAINSNPNSRPYSLMNRGALLNFSGGLHGYDDKEKDYTEEALDLGCNHIVGHRPTLLDPEGRHGSEKQFTSLNVPIAVKMGNETTLQTDYNGKNEDKYVNCRITKFDGDGKPHLVGVSKMLEEHRKFFDDNDSGLNEEIKELYNDIYQEKDEDIAEKERNEFVQYFKSNPPILEKEDKLKEYFKKFGEQHKLDFQESKLDEALKNFNSIKKYQEAFYRNKDKIIEKQRNIANKIQEQSQGQSV